MQGVNGLGQGGNKVREVGFRDLFSLSFSFLSPSYLVLEGEKRGAYRNTTGIIEIKGRLLNLLFNYRTITSQKPYIGIDLCILIQN